MTVKHSRQLLVAHLGQWLHAGVLASASGAAGPVVWSVYWGTALIAALVLATWLSVAKPWGRIRRRRLERARRTRREPDPHQVVWLGALAVPFVDYVGELRGGLMLLTVLGYAGYRSWRSRRSRRGGLPDAVGAAGMPAGGANIG